MKLSLVSFLLLLSLFVTLTTPAVAGLSRHDVLLVVNDSSPISVAIGNYYQSARNIPDINVCHLTTSTNEWIDPEPWYDTIRTPIWDYISVTHPWLKDQIKVILLTKGVPLALWGDAGRESSTEAPLCYLDNVSTTGIEPFGSYPQPDRYDALFSAPYYGRDESFDSFRTSAANSSTDLHSFPNINSVSGFDSGVIVASGDLGFLISSTNGNSWSIIPDRDRLFPGMPMSCVVGDAGYGWALEGGRILASDDNGNSWHAAGYYYSPYTMRSVSFGDANNGWVVGSNGVAAFALHSTIGGDHGAWSTVDLTSLNLPACCLNGVSAAGSDGVVACGSNGVIIRGNQTGGSWTWVQSTGTPNVTYNAVALKLSGGAYAGWVVGNNGTILRTTDGGANWQQQDSGQPSVSLQSIYTYDGIHAWITTGTSTFLRTTDGGAAWETLTLPSNQKIRSVYFSDANNGFAANGTASILSSNDGGTTWATAWPTVASPAQTTTWHQKYLACRLDSYQTPADANGLPLDIKRVIDDAGQPDSTGRFIVDEYGNGIVQELADTSSALSAMKNSGSPGIEEVKHDTGYRFLTDEQRVMGYASWGSNDSAAGEDTQWAKPRNAWQRGSVSTTFVSTSGRSFVYPPDYTNPVTYLSTNPANPNTLQMFGLWQGWSAVLHNSDTGEDIPPSPGIAGFSLTTPITNGYLKIYYPDGTEVTSAEIRTDAGYSLAPGDRYYIPNQSLVPDLIREGCDASIGSVFEPNNGLCGQPQYLLPRYADGYTWAEASCMAMYSAGWSMTAVGDPLMAAYATPPLVNMSSPASDGAAISGKAYTVIASAVPIKQTGINRVEFWLSNGRDIDALLGTVTTPPYSLTFDTTTLPASYNQAIPDGRYVVEAVAYEGSKVRQCGKFSRPIIINNSGSPAAVSIIDPAIDGSRISGTTTIAVSASPSTLPAASRIDLWLHSSKRDMLIGSMPAGQPFNFVFDASTVPAGTYELQAVAYSSTGQASASPERQITVDDQTLVQITQPNTDDQQESGLFTVAATTDSNAPVAKVEFWLGQGNEQGTMLASDDTAPYSCNVDGTSFVDGRYFLRALAYDSSGMLLGTSTPRPIAIFNFGLLAFTLPGSDGQTFSGSLPVQVYAGPNDPAVNHVDLLPDSAGDWTISSTDTSSPFNWTLDTTTLPNGEHTMKAVGYKIGGGQVVDTPCRTITVDNPNLLSVTSPDTDGIVESGTVDLEIGTEPSSPDYGRIEIGLSGESTSATFDLTSRPFVYSLDTTAYPDGIYTITVHAYKPDGRIVVESVATRKLIINNNHIICAKITDARALPDGSPCMLEGKAVSAGTGSSMDGAFNIEESDRSAGVRVAWSGIPISTASTVTILGTIGNNSSTGEREIAAQDVWICTDNVSISPIGFTNTAVGGAAPSNEPYTQGITGGVGLYNTGLLATAWGRVVYVGDDCIYLDDGSSICDGNSIQYPKTAPVDGSAIIDKGTGIKGLKVYFSDLQKPGVDDFVSITGISSIDTVGSNRVRLLRARSSSDVTYFDGYTPARAALSDFVSVPDLMPLAGGTRVRLSDHKVCWKGTSFGNTFLQVYDPSDPLQVHVAISGNPQVNVGDIVTITGVVLADRGPLPFHYLQIDASAGHIYLGGSEFGAMGLMSPMASGRELAISNDDTFKPYTGETVGEILASDWFEQSYYAEGAIGWALSQPDGTVVDLLGELVTDESSDNRVLRLKEAFEPGSGKLLLYLNNPVEALGNHMYSVDIMGGTLTTLSNGDRALVNPSAVYVYTDSNGNYMFAVPCFKGPSDDPVVTPNDPCDTWPWKVKIAP